MKSFRCFVRQFATLISAALCIASTASAANSIKIGVIQSLSGPNAQAGNASLQGAQLAADSINAAGGIKALDGAKIELVPVDIPTPNTAAAATQRLITQHRVAAVVGAFASGTTLAASEVTERAGVPLVTFSFADQITERGYKNIFQITPKASAFGKAQLNYSLDVLKQAGKKTESMAILYEETAYGTTQAKGLREAAAAAGVKVVLDEGYPLGLTDATPLVNKLRGANADLVFPVSSYLNDSLQIVRTMRQQGIVIPTVGGAAGYVIPDFQKGLGAFAEGILSVSASNWDLSPEASTKYKEKYGNFMTHEASIHAAAVDIIAKAMESAKSSKPADVRAALASISSCNGFSKGVPGGCVKFNANGLNEAVYPVLVQWRDGQLVTVGPASDAKTKATFSK